MIRILSLVAEPHSTPPTPITSRRREPRTAAFFDLDKTIIAKSSVLAFGRPFYQGGLINRRAVLRSAYAQFVFALAGADHDQIERMRAYLTAMCTGWDVAQVRDIVSETLHEIIDPIVYDEAVELIASTRPPGATSSSCRPPARRWSGPIGAMLGADHVVATRMVVDGRQVHRRDQPLRLRAGEGRRDPRAGRAARLRPRRLLRLLRFGDGRADAAGGGAPVRRERRPRAAQGRGRVRLAHPDLQQRRTAARADLGHRAAEPDDRGVASRARSRSRLVSPGTSPGGAALAPDGFGARA